MKLDQAVLERLADQHQQSMARIQIATENALMSAWYRLDPDPESKEDMNKWATIMWTILLPAATIIARETRQYMSAINVYTGIGMALPQPNMDWFREEYEGIVLSPFTVTREAGGDLAAGGRQVAKLASVTTRVSEQEIFNQIVDSIEWETTVEFVDERPAKILVADSLEDIEVLTQYEAIAQGYEVTQRSKTAKRWKRVTQIGACGFCQVLAGSTLYSDTARVDQGFAKAAPGKPMAARRPKATGAYHAYCRCSWERLTPDQARKWERKYTEGEWKDVIDQRANVPESEKQGGSQ